MKHKQSTSIVMLIAIACIAWSAHPVQAFTNPELLQAVRESDHNRVSQMLANGADVNYRTPQGNTALIIAAKIGDKPTIQALLEANPAVNFQNQAGATALMIAAKYGHAHVIDILLEEGGDPTIVNDSGISAARFARVFNHPEVYRQLALAENEGMKKQDKNKSRDVTMYRD